MDLNYAIHMKNHSAYIMIKNYTKLYECSNKNICKKVGFQMLFKYPTLIYSSPLFFIFIVFDTTYM